MICGVFPRTNNRSKCTRYELFLVKNSEFIHFKLLYLGRWISKWKLLLNNYLWFWWTHDSILSTLEYLWITISPESHEVVQWTTISNAHSVFLLWQPNHKSKAHICGRTVDQGRYTGWSNSKWEIWWSSVYTWETHQPSFYNCPLIQFLD